MDKKAADMVAPLVGAKAEEVCMMQTLTANIHLLMCAFYKPDINGRHKIILESKAFPSDHVSLLPLKVSVILTSSQYAVDSQIRMHGLNPCESMICIEPPKENSPENRLLGTDYILSIIDQHASDTAVLLLPGIQFYSGELFDIKTITAYAQSKGIFCIWDLAHAAGNVPLKLHDWNVDAAAWCSYKYINSGPGAIGGLFVHEKNSKKNADNAFPNRLSGWWGQDKVTRFKMINQFQPMEGAKGFQISNPSAVDLTSLCASLEVFGLTNMDALRAKSLKLTKYLEDMLNDLKSKGGQFIQLTPTDPERRGAQLSLKLEEGLLAVVMHELEDYGVILDERKPDVIRVAPAPLYNNYTDVWKFMEAFKRALVVAKGAKDGNGPAQGTDELLQTS